MYTKTERNIIYRKALKLLNGVNNVVDKFHDTHWAQFRAGACELLYVASMDEWDKRYHPENVNLDDWLKQSFPEFYFFKPLEPSLFWWPKSNREIRKEVLSVCINFTDTVVDPSPSGFNTCKNCKHWRMFGDNIKGACDFIDYTPSTIDTHSVFIDANADDDSGLEARLVTGADFGCAAHKPKS